MTNKEDFEIFNCIQLLERAMGIDHSETSKFYSVVMSGVEVKAS